MSTGRADLDHKIKISSIQPGEPIFVLRAQDSAAADAVRAWAAIAAGLGVYPAIVEQALQQADRMGAWPTKKLADADHLTEAELDQLAYQFGRRAWNARADRIDPKVMLAEERGYQAAISRLRPLLERLLEKGEKKSLTRVLRGL